MRRMQALTIIVFVVLGLAVAVLAAVMPERGGSSPAVGFQKFARADAVRFSDFPVYDLGDGFEGLRLAHILRVNALPLPDEPTRRNDLSFIYGKCGTPEDPTCLPPLQVQVWSVCERWRDLYPFAPDEKFVLRGVDAATFDGGRRLELYTEKSTIVIFTDRPDLARRAASALRGVNNQIAVGAPLPKATPAELQGTAC
jgi:hypothetical protein